MLDLEQRQRVMKKLTVKCEADELERGVAKTDVETRRCSARSDSRKVKHLGHERAFWRL